MAGKITMKLHALGALMVFQTSLFAGILPDFKFHYNRGAHNPADVQKFQAQMPMGQLEKTKETQVAPILAESGTLIKPSSDPSQLNEHPFSGDYANLVAKTNGKFYSATAMPLMQKVEQVLDEQLVDNADLVFVIDHTSSMEDDIEAIRVSMSAILDKASKRKGVRVGFVTFSDVKSGSRFGYRKIGLGTDYGEMQSFLGRVELMGSVEDVYGAIVKTIEEFEWKSQSKRMIVLISDEKPATGKDTNYTEAQVVAKCRQYRIKTQVFPLMVEKNQLPPK